LGKVLGLQVLITPWRQCPSCSRPTGECVTRLTLLRWTQEVRTHASSQRTLRSIRCNGGSCAATLTAASSCAPRWKCSCSIQQPCCCPFSTHFSMRSPQTKLPKKKKAGQDPARPCPLLRLFHLLRLPSAPPLHRGCPLRPPARSLAPTTAWTWTLTKECFAASRRLC
jgi:hypothetical protein